MNTKWYIGTLIIILTLIGLNQGQTKVANQQIVLQFTDAEMTSVSTHDDAFVAITKKLEAIGIANIEIIESDDTKISIRYYSDIDALAVRDFLSQKGQSLADDGMDELPFDFPKEKLPENYSLVVSDLHQQSNDGISVNGKYAFELKQESTRFSNPIPFRFYDLIVLEQDAVVQIAFKINKVVAIAIDNSSHEIPEVRAGPYVYRYC